MSARPTLPLAVVAALGLAGACTRAPRPEVRTTRLGDAFHANLVENAFTEARSFPRSEWRFDGAEPHRWLAGPGITGLNVVEGRLTGKTTAEIPILHVERTSGLDNADQLHAVEVRMRVSAGSNMHVAFRGTPTVDLPLEAAQAVRLPWFNSTPIVPGDAVQTYTIRPPTSVVGTRIRHLMLRPTDAAGADFAIESVRLVFRREHLASVKSGVSWQGLRDVFRETLVTRVPETVRFTGVAVPSRAALEVVLGSPEEEPVTFRVTVRKGGEERTVLAHTVTTAHRWERRTADLSAFAGDTVDLALSTTAARAGTLGFWGSPTVRQRSSRRAGGPPQVVILMQGDTLRTDHLDVYGYARETAPTLKRLAGEGVLFRHAITQTSWTKAATPSIMASLFPTSHGVLGITDRLPASATTIAEVYRKAGYATVSFSSVPFTGQFTNLHQGFEELHEVESTAGRAGPRGAKTAREYVDRLTEWLDAHPDRPVFVYLHVFDPHAPYEPNRPFDTLYADPKGREQFLGWMEKLRKTVKDPFMAQRGMATPQDLAEAGIDRDAFIRYCKDWYDGSIRGMDTEIARLVERLETLGLRDRSLLAFYADHGEEFHEHGRMWHGLGVYGEMIRVPLILWGPGHVPRAVEVAEPVQLVDVMPTLLDLSGLKTPPEAQGQSLRPLVFGTASSPVGGIDKPAPRGWNRRPLIAEKHPAGTGNDFPNASLSYAIMDGRWKLIHNVARPPEVPEYELFDFYADPHDQKNLAAAHADEVQRLARVLGTWRQWAQNARLKPDSDATKGMSAEQLEQLRSLGYIK
ncbi:MAG TPA: sulfatase-like hydrolase/transferase [Vicinamibacteria bacterium]|nr:sulfatase-like hydrolase/transferase [Vicinamibacteria bacterium]